MIDCYLPVHLIITRNLFMLPDTHFILNSKLLTFYGREKDIILVKPGKTPQIRSGQRGPLGIKQLPLIKYKKEYDYLSILCALVISVGKHTSFFSSLFDSITFNLYFPDHMKERGIDVLEFVERDIDEVMQGREFEKLSDAEKEQIIETLHAKWSNPDNEVRNRIKLFAVRSPEILKPILES